MRKLVTAAQDSIGKSAASTSSIIQCVVNQVYESTLTMLVTDMQGGMHMVQIMKVGKSAIIPEVGDSGILLIAGDRKYFLPLSTISGDEADWAATNMPPGTSFLGQANGACIATTKDGSIMLRSGENELSITVDAAGESKMALRSKSMDITTAASKMMSSASANGCEYSLSVMFSPKDFEAEPVYTERIGNVVGFGNMIRDILTKGVDSIFNGEGGSATNLNIPDAGSPTGGIVPYSIQQQEGVIREVTYNNPNKGPSLPSDSFSSFSSTDFRRIQKFFIDGRVTDSLEAQANVSGDMWDEPPARVQIKTTEKPTGEKSSSVIVNTYTGIEEGRFASLKFPDDQNGETMPSPESESMGKSAKRLMGPVDRNARYVLMWNADKIDYAITNATLRIPVKKFDEVYKKWEQLGYDKVLRRTRIYHSDSGIRVNISMELRIGSTSIPSKISTITRGALKSATIRWETFGATETNSDIKNVKFQHGIKSGYLSLELVSDPSKDRYIYKGVGSCFIQGVDGYEQSNKDYPGLDRWYSPGSNLFGNTSQVEKKNHGPITFIRQLVHVDDGYGVAEVVPVTRQKIEDLFIAMIRPDMAPIKDLGMAAADKLSHIRLDQFVTQVAIDGMSITGLRVGTLALRTPYFSNAKTMCGENGKLTAYLPYRGGMMPVGMYNATKAFDLEAVRTASAVWTEGMAGFLHDVRTVVASLTGYLVTMIAPPLAAEEAKAEVLKGGVQSTPGVTAIAKMPVMDDEEKPGNVECLNGALNRVSVLGVGPGTSSAAGPMTGTLVTYGAAAGVSPAAGTKFANRILDMLSSIYPSELIDAFRLSNFKDCSRLIPSLRDESDSSSKADKTDLVGLFADSDFGKQETPFPGYIHMLETMKRLAYPNINRGEVKIKIGDTEHKVVDFSSGIANVLDMLFQPESNYQYENPGPIEMHDFIRRYIAPGGEVLVGQEVK